ncbi:LysR family transcriptional regulator [Sandaracinobacteroides hominis]|uniref:LysR family transcriptional regulator n=1 Tax=Sandaracinobacteroides hominis TaxID=2780086 RepID=UPI0018F3C398|nr:LysR family transcriptional regulator [Sandaracinobacteroides hominis]
MSVQLRQIEFVIAASEYGSLRKAAAALGVQESAISRQIRELEYELDSALFVRNSSGVRLTAAGRDFVDRSRKIISQIGLAKAAIKQRSDGEQGDLRIGIFSSLASGFLPELFNTYCRQYEHVRLTFIECNPSEHVAAIRKSNTDIAFLTGNAGWAGCVHQQFWNERIYAVLPAIHPLASQEQIDINDLAGDRFIVSESPPGQEIHDYLIKRLADLGYHPDIKQQSVGRDNLLHLVALGIGITLTSQATIAAAFPGIAYVPIAHEILPFSAVWLENNENPALQRLLDMARSQITPQVAIRTAP